MQVLQSDFLSARLKLFVSVLTLGEISKGIDVLPDSERKFVLHDWLNVDLPSFFNGRI